MADDVQVKVLGIDELAAGSKQLAANVDEAAGKAFVRVADDVASQVRLRIPRRTGRLAETVRGAPHPDGALVEMGTGVPYAVFVEHGGRGFPHSDTGNYLYPAAMDAQPTLITAAERAAQTEIEAMRWPTPT